MNGFLEPVLQVPDMPHRVVYFVTRLHRQAAVIRKTVELFDNLATSVVHVLSSLVTCSVLQPVFTRYRVELVHSNRKLFT
jgi:hypothetical protein